MVSHLLDAGNVDPNRDDLPSIVSAVNCILVALLRRTWADLQQFNPWSRSDLAGPSRATRSTITSVTPAQAGVHLSEECTGGSVDPGLRRDDGGEAADADRDRAARILRRPRPFLPGDFVTTEQGTGLVHMAPDHGEDDFLLCKANGIEPVFAVEGDGRYRADWAWLGGQGSVINAKFNAPDGPICSDLRAAGALLAASADYKHSYPHSWRSKAKLIFRATPQWFIPMDAPLLPLEGGGDSREARRVGVVGPAQAAVSMPPPPPGPREDARLSTSPLQGEGITLRQTALTAIAATRWVPPRARTASARWSRGGPTG